MLLRRRHLLPSILYGSAIAALLCTPMVARAVERRIPLEYLEAQIDAGPGVQASASTVVAKAQALRATEDKAGLGYLYDAEFGPAAIIVANAPDNHVLRFEQDAGLTLPLWGTAIDQQLAVVGAAEQEQIAKIELDQIRRLKLYTLRKAYIQYWGYDDQANVANGYVSGSQGDLQVGRSLRKTGFVIDTDLLDISESIEKIKFDVESFRNLQRAQLALVDTALGYELPLFQPVSPDFFDRCVPDRQIALKSAFDVDPSIATLDAETVQVERQLADVKGSSLAALATGEGGTTTDINHRVSGYNLNAELDLALPTHARDEERAHRAQYEAELDSLAFSEKQRHIEVQSALDAALDNVSSARTLLDQAKADENARRADLKNATAQFAYLRSAPQGSLVNLHAKRNDLLTAQIATATALENVLLQATELLLVAPAACGGSYQPIPTFTLPPHGKPSQHKALSKPSATPMPKPSPSPG